MSIIINFKKVCYQDCPYRKTYLKESIMYADSTEYMVETIIGCEHEKVCKAYLESK